MDGKAEKMPYKGYKGDKNPLIAKKREELAKKKSQIIRGQNTQTASAAKKSGASNLGPIRI